MKTKKLQFMTNLYLDKPVAYWTHNDLLNYTINTLLKEFNIPFLIYFDKNRKNKSPSGCYQLGVIRKLLNCHFNSDSIKTKEYIDWCITCAKNNNQTIYSYKYFTSNYIIKYKSNPKINNVSSINRTTLLPNHLKIDTKVNSYGDLAFLIQAYPELENKLSPHDLDVLKKIT